MAELTINWETLNRVSPEDLKAKKVVTSEAPTAPAPDDAPATAAAPAVSDRPFFIYVSDPGTTSTSETPDKVTLDDDRVKLGTHAFHAVKMTDDVAKADPLLAEKGGKAVPRFIFVSADFKSVKPLEGGSLKLGEVWGAMKATANRFYAQDLDSVVKDLKSVLIEFDRVNAERKVLDEKEKRLTSKATEADKKALATARADLDSREKKATDRKDSLWKLRPKDDKAAADAKPADAKPSDSKPA